MKYLLFVYHNENQKKDDFQKIATELSPIVDSEDIKYIYGPTHVVFNFITEMSQGELSIYVDMMSEEMGDFKYILTPTPKTISSNMDPEHLKHLMDVRSTNDEDEPSMYFLDFLKENFGDINKSVCNLSIDEILDKIKEKGIQSLSKQEKDKLDNYSQSIKD
jgi:hypothetical protein